MAAPLKATVNLCQKHLQPAAVQVRHGHKFVTKNPRPKPMEHRIFEAVTKPIFPKPQLHPAETCGRQKQLEPLEFDENRYEQFLIKQMKQLFNNSQMIIVCQRLPCSNLRLQKIRVDLKKEGMKLSICNNKHALEVIQGTKLENMAPYFIDSNLLITSPEPRPKELIKVTRKIPELVVLGGYIEDRLVSRHQIQEITSLPPIEQLLGQLAGCLNLIGGGKTLSLLNSHQTNLSTNLGQYVKQCQEGNNS